MKIILETEMGRGRPRTIWKKIIEETDNKRGKSLTELRIITFD